MATAFGQLQEFCPETEPIEAYLERASIYFSANGIEDDKHVSILLSVIGPKVYGLLRNLCAPDRPNSKTYVELCTVLKDHFNPKPLVIAERFHFNRRDQRAGESIAEYVAELRRMAATCDFGDQLESALRDRLVCGLGNASAQRRLLAEPDLSLDKALKITQGMEAAEKNSKTLKVSDSIGLVGKVAQIQPQIESPCYRCGRKGHVPNDCKFKDASCHYCGKKGHIAPACRNKKFEENDYCNSKGRSKRPRPRANYLQRDDFPKEESDKLYVLTTNRSDPVIVELTINGISMKMELDTGASVSIVSEKTWKSKLRKVKLSRSPVRLRTYTDQTLRVLGEVWVNVICQKQRAKLRLVIVAGNGPSLFGRDWLACLKLDWHRMHLVQSTTSVQELLSKYKSLFEGNLGTVESFEGKLLLKQDAQPKFFKARPVPFAIRDTIGMELDRLEAEGVVEKVSHSDWAAPIVPVRKKDGQYRLCGDYKLTINPALNVNQYPLPKTEDLFAALAGGKLFTRLDISQAYLQIKLDEESSKYTTVNTHKGLYRYKRLPFGVASAPALFQQLMDVTLQGIPHVICFLDDILVTGGNDQDHLQNLEATLKRLQDKGFRLKPSKCAFMQSSVEYLGHRVDQEGLHPLPDKTQAVQNAPPPKNIQELRSFLGLLNYYSKFIANLSTIIHPLNELLEHSKQWEWTAECARAFQSAKDALVSYEVLVHYDPALPLVLAGDASAYGIGAVISHVMPDGTERPIAYSSRTLSASERNYAQLEKEGLSLVYGVKKFHQYLYGRKFILFTDHKPLVAIFGSKKGVPSLAAARLQRWAILLSGYQYEIRFKPTQQHCNADGLSRLPLKHTELRETLTEGSSICNIRMEHMPISAIEVQRASRRDLILSRVIRFTKTGWPESVSEVLKPYFHRRTELSVEGDCLLWGTRVVIPKQLQSALLQELHQSHPGASRMKSIARSYFWWPKLDKEIEDQAKNCRACQAVRHTPVSSPVHPWTWPSQPWQRVHMDLAGPFLGKMYCVIVDAHSKWPEVFELTTTTSSKIIELCRQLFASYGLPHQIVTDNGPQFVSDEFELFLKHNGIKHLKSAPYHPSTNGEAERFIQTFKKAMRAGIGEGLSLQHRLQNFLLSYRSTAHATTKKSPSELFLRRSLRTKLDLLLPDVQQSVTERQAAQVAGKQTSVREFDVDGKVLVRNYGDKSRKWISAVVLKRLGPVGYLVKTANGNLRHCHVDQLLSASVDLPDECDTDFAPSSTLIPASATAPQVESSSSSTRRYPSRVRQPPDRLM